ncbi:MAG: hypothetical protein L6R37_006109 [Teloschistes peruensis]|nr:MAG: hypothetical protein L6R37_006109 [Teloschistes peruensis]
MAPIRVGIIGLSADPTAWATLAHVGPIKEPSPLAKDFQLTALATSSPESAKAAAKAHGLPEEKAYSNGEDIAKDPDVDLVVVSVKVPMHKQLMMPALHAGKDVFVEWPLGASLAEAEEVTSLAKEKGVKTYVGLQARVQSAMLKAKEIVSSGVLGRITSSTVLGIDSQLLNLPEKARYVNDPNSGTPPPQIPPNPEPPFPSSSLLSSSPSPPPFPLTPAALSFPPTLLKKNLYTGASILSIPSAHTLDVILHVLSSEFSSLTATLSTTYPTIRYTTSPPTTNPPTLSLPEPRKTPNDIALSGTLTPYPTTNPTTPPKTNTEGAALSFHYIVTAPTGAPNLFQWIVNGERGAFKMEGPSFAVQMARPKLFVAKGIVDFEGAVLRHKMVEAIARSAARGTRESYL